MSSMSFDPVTGKMRIDPDPRGGDRRPRWSDIDARIASGEQLPPQDQWFSGGNPFTLPQSGGGAGLPTPFDRRSRSGGILRQEATCLGGSCDLPGQQQYSGGWLCDQVPAHRLSQSQYTLQRHSGQI